MRRYGWGKDILSGLIKGNIFITSICGGKGICKRCKIKILKGRFHSETIEENIYLACRTKKIMGDIDIELLPETILPENIETENVKVNDIWQISNSIKDIFEFSPVIEKFFLKLSPPSFEDTLSDYERLSREIKKAKGLKLFRISTSSIRELPYIIREKNCEVTATISKDPEYSEIINIEVGDTSRRNFGVAVDVGTTTVVAGLVDLNTGNILKVENTFNKQISFGDDIISRIIFAEKGDGLEKLHRVIVETINEMILNMVEKTGISTDDIYCIAISGNMTMVHLLLKINPSFLRKEPYIPVAKIFPIFKGSEIGVKINPEGVVAVIPGGYPYVGGDITSGIIVSGIYKENVLSLFVNIGTNGEIVVGKKDFLVCCSASAGPAFEGSGVKDGVKIVKGAIYSVQINEGDISFETIGNTRPVGICGSGYIELLYELFRNNIINRNGVFIDEQRIRENDGIKEFVVARNITRDKDIVITQTDIENLIRAKGAIFSAISTILKTLGLQFEDIKKFYIAGGFGSHLNIDKAIKIGFFPEIPGERFKFLGNTSLKGAIHYILSKEFRELSEKIINKLSYIDLSRNPIYMEEYMKSLFIPHTDYLGENKND